MIDDRAPVRCPICFGRGRFNESEGGIAEEVVLYVVDLCDECSGTGRVVAARARELLAKLPGQG